MSKSAALLAVALAMFVCAGVWWLLVSQRAAPPAPPTLLSFSPSAISGLQVRVEGETLEAVRGAAGEWELLPTPGSQSMAWPLNAGQVRAALSVLAGVRFEGAEDPGEAPPGAPVVSLTQDDGSAHSLAFLGQPVGGRLLAVAQDGAGKRRAGFIDAAIRDMLLSPGPRGWRTKTALPGVGVEVSRVRLVTPASDLLLGQVAGVWTLREPVGARADDGAVQNILATLTSLTIERFIDDGSVDAGSAGLEAPALRVFTETDARAIDDDGEVTVRTHERRLDVGGAADLEGKLLFASPDEGATIFTVAANALRAVPADATACIARPATGVLPSNVGMVHIQFAGGPERGCRRGLDGWDELLPDGSMLPLEPQPVQDMLEFLAARIPPTLRILDAADSTGPPWATVTLYGFADEPLDEVALVAADGAPAALRGRLLRVYSPGPWPALLTPQGIESATPAAP